MKSWVIAIYFFAWGVEFGHYVWPKVEYKNDPTCEWAQAVIDKEEHKK